MNAERFNSRLYALRAALDQDAREKVPDFLLVEACWLVVEAYGGWRWLLRRWWRAEVAKFRVDVGMVRHRIGWRGRECQACAVDAESCTLTDEPEVEEFDRLAGRADSGALYYAEPIFGRRKGRGCSTLRTPIANGYDPLRR